MTPPTIAAGWIFLAASLIALGIVIVRGSASAWAERQAIKAERIIAEQAKTDVDVAHFRSIPNMAPAEWERPLVISPPLDADAAWAKFMDGRLTAGTFVPAQRDGSAS